jgi:hypothetical protein
VRVGTSPIPAPAPEPPKVEPPPAPVGPTMQVLLVKACRWSNGAAGAFNVVQMPQDDATAALKNGYAIIPGTPTAAALQAQNTPDPYYYNQHPEIVPDVFMEAPAAIRYLDEHKNKIIHSAYDRYTYDEKASGGIATTKAPPLTNTWRISMASYRTVFNRNPESRWRHDHNTSMSTTAVRSIDASDRLSGHEGAHAFAVLAFGGSIRRATNQPMNTRVGRLAAHVEMDRNISNPEDEIVVRLAGLAFDFIHHGIDRRRSETDDGKSAWNCALRMVGNVEGTAEEHYERGWQKACDLVTIYEREIGVFANYIYKHGSVSGEELCVIFNRLVPVSEDGGQSKAGASAAFNAPPRPKRKPRKDLEDLDQDTLDETDESQTNDEVEEEDVLEEAGPSSDEDSVQDIPTNPSHIKKKKQKVARAGKFAGEDNCYWRTDGQIGGGEICASGSCLSVRVEEPATYAFTREEQILYRREVDERRQRRGM